MKANYETIGEPRPVKLTRLLSLTRLKKRTRCWHFLHANERPNCHNPVLKDPDGHLWMLANRSGGWQITQIRWNSNSSRTTSGQAATGD